MALQKPKVLRGGINLAEAYHRVHALVLTAPVSGQPVFEAHVAIYRDRAARNADVDPVEVRPYVLPTPQDFLGNLFQQAYLGLKALPEYSEAQDV